MGCRLDNLRVQRLAVPLMISRLASLSNTSDLVINILETVGTVGIAGTQNVDVCDRICNALGISRATAGFVDMK